MGNKVDEFTFPALHQAPARCDLGHIRKLVEMRILLMPEHAAFLVATIDELQEQINALEFVVDHEKQAHEAALDRVLALQEKFSGNLIEAMRETYDPNAGSPLPGTL